MVTFNIFCTVYMRLNVFDNQNPANCLSYMVKSIDYITLDKLGI